MPRLLWKGTIKFGLINAPVALYPASKRDDVEFEWLDKRTLDPIGYQRINKETGEEIGKNDIVRVYQYEEGKYVILADEEINTASIKAAHTVDMIAFADVRSIPLLYFDTPYYLAPISGGEKVYALLREALKRTGKIGLAVVMIQTRQHLAALIPSGAVLVLNTLRWANAVRPFDTLLLPDEKNLQSAGVTVKELVMAMQLVESMTEEEWNPARYHDPFRDDILALVQQKIKSGNIVERAEIASETSAPAQQQPANKEEEIEDIPDDLTILLKRSLPSSSRGKTLRGERTRDRR